ncbi:hypothetical protein ABPG72_017840 [Tetrahymena utriculariae]
MDNIQQNIKCKKHQLKDIEFIQVNEVLDQAEDKQIFYCSQCINSDIQFKGINYLLIEQIISEGSSNILLKWPPVNDCQVIQKLIDLTTNQNDQFNFVQQVTSYFTDFKDQLITKLDQIQKIMINKALDQQFNKEQILKKYQEISNILTLRQLIQDKKDLDASSLEFKHLITKQESEKVKNTELLQNLVTQITTKQEKISFELPNMIKEQIFLLFNQISFFNEDNLSQQNLDKSNQKNPQIIDNKSQIIVDKVMSLISNKSNFCSDQFLDSNKKDLKNLSLLFQTSTFSNVFKENKQPIKFDNINDQNLQLINEYVDHQILIGSNQNYKNTIEQSELKLTIDILNPKFNFLNENFTNEIKKYLVDTYPFLKQFARARVAIIENNNFFATNFKNGNDTNILQDYILKKDKKYIYRFQVQNNHGQHFLIGLVNKKHADNSSGYNQYLSCHLKNENSYLMRYNNWGVSKQIKGENLIMQQDTIFEMRVDLQNKILEISDYPNYKFVLELEEKYKNKLIQEEDLQFYIGLFDPTKIILKQAYQVDQLVNYY